MEPLIRVAAWPGSCRSPARRRSGGCSSSSARRRFCGPRSSWAETHRSSSFEDADLDEAVEGAIAAKMRNMRRGLHRGQPRLRAVRRSSTSSVAAWPIAWRHCRSAAAPNRASASGPLDRRGGVTQGRIAGRRRRRPRRHRADRRLGVGGRTATATRPPCSPACRATPRCCDQEIFGPVAPLTPFETEADAIAAANDTEYGLVSVRLHQ